MNNYCDCGTIIAPGEKICLKCKTKPQDKPKPKRGSTTVDGRCAHIEHGERCPRPGVTSQSIKGGPFYCKEHNPSKYTQGRPEVAAEAIKMAKQKLRGYRNYD